MWLIKQKLRGVHPPATLSSDMIPPSMRKPSESVVVNIQIIFFSLVVYAFIASSMLHYCFVLNTTVHNTVNVLYNVYDLEMLSKTQS